jgi:DNA modification methylase
MRKPKVIKLKRGVLVTGDAAKVMPKNVPDESVDMILTSPPYDQQRVYQGYTFAFQEIAQQCARVLKPGGVIVWVVADATIKGSESLTSFKHAIYFSEQCGLRLHDTMIFAKNNPIPGDHGPRYRGSFEYMFVFSKGKPKTYNPITWRTKDKVQFAERFRLEEQGRRSYSVPENAVLKTSMERTHPNIFFYTVAARKKGYGRQSHPAVFPEHLAEDQIRTWTNPGDLVLDPMCGSGTSCYEAARLDRAYVGIDISPAYLKIAQANIEANENLEPILEAEAEAALNEIPLDFE